MTETTEPMDARHLRREVRTALELALVSAAPTPLVDRLAAVAGLLEVVAELPADTPMIAALLPELTRRAKSCLQDWDKWRRNQDEKLPRG